MWVLTPSGVCLQVRVYFFGLDTEALLHTYATVPFGYAMSLAGLCKVCAPDFFFAQPTVLAFRIPEAARIHVNEQFHFVPNYFVHMVKAEIQTQNRIPTNTGAYHDSCRW